ncbi:MAG: hypothetical protein AAF125_15445 [Chloroflexota bacterium]
MAAQNAPIDPKLLEILRCPVAVHYTDAGDDPGQLQLVREFWLYSADSGYKYPIIDGIPKMLIEEGAKWKDTEIDDLPVPPPNEAVYAAAEEALTPEMQQVAVDLAARADETRADTAQRLRDTAASIREERSAKDSSALKQRAAAIATGLENAADVVNGNPPATPVPAETDKGVNWALVAFLFALGLVVGLLMRGGRRSS